MCFLASRTKKAVRSPSALLPNSTLPGSRIGRRKATSTVKGSGSGQFFAHVVGVAAARVGSGYWLAASDGRVVAFGDASPFGSSAPQGQPVVGIAASRVSR